MGFFKRLFGGKNGSILVNKDSTTQDPIAQETVENIGVEEFVFRLAEIALDLKSLYMSIGSQSLQEHDEKRIFTDAIILQLYAARTYITIRCVQQKLSHDEGIKISRSYNDAISKALNKMPEVANKGLETLIKLDEHGREYDNLLSSGGSRGFLDLGFLYDVGRTFAKLSKSEQSFHYERILNLGKTIYKKCLTRCMSEFGNSRIDFNL
jgi:hypothetical protein